MTVKKTSKGKSKQKAPAKQPVKLVKPKRTLAETLFPIIIFVFAFLLYSNTFKHGFVMDDGADITNNVTVQKGFKGIAQVYKESSVFGSTGENFGPYRPFTLTVFAIIKGFYGNNSGVFHIVEVLLYGLLCVFLYLLVRKFFPQNAFIPFVATMLFAAHPVHTEVAANIKSTDEILSLLFCTLAALSGWQYLQTNKTGKAFLTFLFFILAMFTKESAITFVVVIPLMYYFFFPDSWKRHHKKILSIGGLLTAGAFIYLIARHFAVDPIPEDIPVINNTVAKSGFNERYATISWIMLYYLRLLVFPHPLSWDYSYNQIPLKSWTDPMVIISLLIYGGLIAFALLKLKTKNVFSFCILFFLITIALTTNIFILIIATMAERFLFTPSLAFCIALAYALTRIDKKAVWAAMLLLVPYSVKTFDRNKDWKSNLSLFAAGAWTSPESYRTHMAYGWESLTTGEKETDTIKKRQYFDTALVHLRKGVSIYPRLANDWYNLGVTYGHAKNTDSSIYAYKQALGVDSMMRNANYNVGSLLIGKKDYSNSIKYLLKVEKVDPNFMDIQFKIGLVYHYLNDLPNAAVHYEKFLATHPGNKDAEANLAIAKRALGQQ